MISAPSDHNYAGSTEVTLQGRAKREIKDLHYSFEARKAELIASYDTVPEIEHQSVARNVIVLHRQIHGLLERSGEGYSAIREPWDEAIEILRDARSAFVDPLQDAKADLAERLTKFQLGVESDAKQERADIAAEFIAKGDPEPEFAPPRERRPVIRSDTGASSHLSKRRSFVVEDIKEIPADILASEKVHKAIISVARDRLDAGEEIDGISKKTIERSYVRS